MKLGFWFWLCVKRQLKKPVFWMQFMILPLSAFVFHGAAGQEEGLLHVALAVEADETGLAEQAAEILLAREGVLKFYRCGTREQVLLDVQSRRAECGFVFREGFGKGILDGDLKKTVELIRSPSTVAGELASESVSSAVMSLAGPAGLEKLASRDFFQEAGAAEENARLRMKELYDRFLTDGSTFSFLYETADGAEADVRQWERQVFPVRGLGAVYIWAAALFAVAAVQADVRKGVYGSMPGAWKYAAVYLSALTPALLAAGACLAAVALSGVWTAAGRELSAILVYSVAAALTAAVLWLFVRREKILCALIPALLFGSLVLCPIVIDLGQWIPAVFVLQRLFPPYYYAALF